MGVGRCVGILVFWGIRGLSGVIRIKMNDFFSIKKVQGDWLKVSVYLDGDVCGGDDLVNVDEWDVRG